MPSISLYYYYKVFAEYVSSFASVVFISQSEAKVHMSSRNKQFLELLIIIPVYNLSVFLLSIPCNTNSEF